MSLSKNHNLKYLVANIVDEQWGLHVTTIGFQSILPDTNYPPKGHPSSYWYNPERGRTLNEYQLIYVTKGEGVFRSASIKQTKVLAGTIILLFPNEWHTYKPLKNIGWDAYWIGFKGKSMQALVTNSFFSTKDPVLYIGFNEQVVRLFDQAIEIANHQATSYQQMMAGITHHLIGLIFYSKKNNSFRDKEIIHLINKGRMLIGDNSYNSKSVEEIAKELNISYSWFRRVFKLYTGLSPIQYQMEIKIQKAKELLTSTSMQVKEIAYELDFESVSYFVTFFKKRYGVSPNVYRYKMHSSPGNIK